MPHPSTGCQTCKNRRIKCDGAKPTCQRCTKSQRLCVESIDTKRACLSIHSENLYASGKTKRPRGPRSSLTLFRPNSDLPSRAVAYYLNYYLGTAINLPTVSACMSECLTSWKASGRESGMVDLAISSLALAIFSRTQKHRPAAREAFKAYGRLLSVAKEDITQAKILTRWPEGIDECLLTVVLMGWYETTMHKLEYFGPKDAIAPMHSWSHYDGAMAILRAWNMSYTAPSSVVKQARRGIIRLALLRSYQLPDWILDGHRFGERSIDLSFDKLLVQAANLRHALKCHKVKKSLHAPMSEHLEHQARELDEASQDWAGQIPSAWSYRPLDLAETSQWSGVDFYSSTIYCCTNPGYATVWINYFTIRMIILSTYLGLLKLDPPSEFIGSASGKERFACSIQLKEMADSLASTVPFCLGRFELGKSHDLDTSNEPTVILKTNERILPALALPAVWPMSVASGLDGVEPAQQLWFSTQLARLGQVLGDGALECAGTDQWRHEL